jgi:hypothetical protein
MTKSVGLSSLICPYLRLDASRDKLFAEIVKADFFVHFACGLLALGSVMAVAVMMDENNDRDDEEDEEEEEDDDY